MAVTVAEEWLNICAGCEISILDIGEPLLGVLAKLKFVHMPVLMDHKYFGQTGDRTELDIPEADVGIVSGGVRNEKEKHVAEEMRKKCKTLGIPALANMSTVQDLYDKVYRDSKTTEPGETPTENLPPLTDSVKAVDEIVKVDVYIPGCPTAPELIAEALTCLLEGKPFDLPERSVCDDCPLKREKKASGGTLKRQIEPMEVAVGQPWENTRCYMEQGYLCLGPVTRAGCARSQEEGTEKVPRCIKGHMTCRGCFGPIRKGANPLVEMMGALSSIGLDPKQIMDRRALLNRYIGAQKRLRPLPTRPAR